MTPDIADIIAGELKVSRGTAYDMMREALKEASPVEPVVQNNCIKCANADSWGLPDKPFCRSCVSNSEWKPLNASSKNPATPPAAQPAVQREHITDGRQCWCNPDIDYVDPETGAAVIVHKEPQ